MEKAKIISGYTSFYNANNRHPNSIAELAKSLKTTETKVMEFFGSIRGLREKVLESFITNTLETLETDANYADFSAREKMLSLFYTLFEEFKSERSYLTAVYKSPSFGKGGLKDAIHDFKGFFRQFDARCEGIINEAKQKGEIKNRMFIGDYYAKGFKLSFTYIMRVWLQDESEGFQTTDAAIEKSINLALDLLESRSFDSILDFGKFALKTKV